MNVSLGVFGVVKKNRGGRIYRVMKRLFNDYLKMTLYIVSTSQ